MIAVGSSLFAVLLVAQTGDLMGRLDLAAKSNDVEARKILTGVVQSLRGAKEMHARERAEVVKRLAGLIAVKARTPEEVLEIAGGDAARSVARQILFRRYVEQWSFSLPLSLTVSFDCPLGQEPRLREVRAFEP